MVKLILLTLPTHGSAAPVAVAAPMVNILDVAFAGYVAFCLGPLLLVEQNMRMLALAAAAMASSRALQSASSSGGSTVHDMEMKCTFLRTAEDRLDCALGCNLAQVTPLRGN